MSVEDLQQAKLLDRYLELLNDEEPDVQSISIKCLPWVLSKINQETAYQSIVPMLKKILPLANGKVQTTILNQMGRFSESVSSTLFFESIDCNFSILKLQNLDLFPEMEDHLRELIKSSFIDNGKKIEDDFNIGIFKGLNKCDSENELITGVSADLNKVSEWQVNQQCICFNLPALALFLNE